MGIDPGLTRCGYGVVQRAPGRGQPLAVAAGVLTSPRDLALPHRLHQLSRELGDLLDEYRPGVVAVEQVLFSGNQMTAMATGQASGIALAAAVESGAEVVTFTPTQVKLTVAGDGRADKEMVASMVVRQLRLSVTPRPADAADALALALTYLATAPLAGRVAAQGAAPRSIDERRARATGGGTALAAAVAAAQARHASGGKRTVGTSVTKKKGSGWG